MQLAYRVHEYMVTPLIGSIRQWPQLRLLVVVRPPKFFLDKTVEHISGSHRIANRIYHIHLQKYVLTY